VIVKVHSALIASSRMQIAVKQWVFPIPIGIAFAVDVSKLHPMPVAVALGVSTPAKPINTYHISSYSWIISAEYGFFVHYFYRSCLKASCLHLFLFEFQPKVLYFVTCESRAHLGLARSTSPKVYIIIYTINLKYQNFNTPYHYFKYIKSRVGIKNTRNKIKTP